MTSSQLLAKGLRVTSDTVETSPCATLQFSTLQNRSHGRSRTGAATSPTLTVGNHSGGVGSGTHLPGTPAIDHGGNSGK